MIPGIGYGGHRDYATGTVCPGLDVRELLSPHLGWT